MWYDALPVQLADMADSERVCAGEQDDIDDPGHPQFIDLEVWPCDHCWRGFSSLKALNLHCSVVHGVVALTTHKLPANMTNCPACGRNFHTKL
eukprot:12924005-Prorocentrum_lima.AAC.1